MDTAQWPQAMEEIVPNTYSKPGLEKRVRPQKEQALNCPRCNSINTKFCYYNNYSLTQPRYFCKGCRRYWTEGGSLRNIPFGGCSRKNKRSSSSSSSPSSSSSLSSKKLPDLVVPPQQPSCSHSTSQSQNPKVHESQDLNLAFPSHHDFKTISELIQVPNFDNNNSSKNLSALELLTGISSRGMNMNMNMNMNSFMPMPMQMSDDQNTIYSSGFSMQEFKPTLNFSLDGLGIGSLHQGVQESASGRLLFPFEDLKQQVSISTTSDIEQNREQGGDSTGYWNGVLGGGGGGGSW